METYEAAFQDPEPVNGTKNAWEYYFEQPSPHTLKEVYDSERVILSNWNLHMAENSYSKKKLTRLSSVLQHIPFNRTTQIFLDRIKEETLKKAGTEKILGVYYRGTDYAVLKPVGHAIPPPKELLSRIAKEKMQEWNISKIIFMTEEQEAFDFFQSRFPDMLYVERPRIQKYDGSVYTPFVIPEKASIYSHTLLYLAEVYILAHCDAIIGSKCNGLLTAFTWNQFAFSHIEIIDMGKW